MKREFSLREAFTYMWEEEGAKKRFLTIVAAVYVITVIGIIFSVASAGINAVVAKDFSERLMSIGQYGAPLRPGDYVQTDSWSSNPPERIGYAMGGSLITLAIGGVFMLLQVIGGILATGYSIELMRNIIRSKDRYVPGFEDMFGKFRVGFKSIIPGIVLFIILTALAIAGLGIFIVPLRFLLEDNPDAANTSTVLLLVGGYILFILAFILTSISQTAIFTATNSVLKSLNPITICKVLWHSLLHLIIYTLVSVVIVAPLILCIYVFAICTFGMGLLLFPFIFVYLGFVQYYLLGFIYKHAVVKAGLVQEV